MKKPYNHCSATEKEDRHMSIFGRLFGGGSGIRDEELDTQWEQVKRDAEDVASFGSTTTREERKAALEALPHNDAGVRLFQANQVDDAIKSYTRALRIKPDYARAHDNVATALAAKWADTQNRRFLLEAKQHYEAAIKAWPGFDLARDNLRTLQKYL
jgi:tetratricopeptide (TPR) repeat protein